MRRHYILIPLAALLAIFPLLVHGLSCGQDLGFHLQSWLDAAQQLRHGAYPHWAYSPAYEAGEPRFLFYPPLSWLLGALLTMVLPIAAVPIVYIWIAITAAGFSMHHLARHFTVADSAAPHSAAFSPGENAALLAAFLYMVNPYMLLNAFYRSADAELLAAAWVPLLLLAILRQRPTVRGIAIPLALLWLTNAPSAVMGTYTLLLVAALRLGATWVAARRNRNPHALATLAPLALTVAGGTSLGLALTGFYLIPAAYEQRFVQIAMAIIPNMRYQDNYLFHRTSDPPHNDFNAMVSRIAVALLAVTAAVLVGLYLKRRSHPAEPKSQTASPLPLCTLLTIVCAVIAILLLPISAPVWEHLPKLKFLQFPWRLLTILSSVLGLTFALLLARLRPGLRTFWIAAPLSLAALTLFASHFYRQECDPQNFASFALSCFNSSHGVPATDEYTPGDADNDDLRSDNPAWWLTPEPNAYAPNTFPNPNETNPNYDGSIALEHTLSARAPTHLTLTLAQPETLVLNLRDFHDWAVTRTTLGSSATDIPPHIRRDDGLLAIAVPAGTSTIDIHWQHTLDQQLGLAISALALLALGFTLRRSRKIEP